MIFLKHLATIAGVTMFFGMMAASFGGFAGAGLALTGWIACIMIHTGYERRGN
jgi:hypothetical protein